MRGYGIRDTIKNVMYLLYTRLFWKNARIIRLPFLIRNRKNVKMSPGFTCGSFCRVNPGPAGLITFGQNFTMGDQCQIEGMESVVIGDDVLLASRVYIGDATHGNYSGEKQSKPDQKPIEREISSNPITIGDNVWIGNGVSILPGVSIGKGAIIGAGSVVTRNIPNETIAVGNPARVIKHWNGIEWEKV